MQQLPLIIDSILLPDPDVGTLPPEGGDLGGVEGSPEEGRRKELNLRCGPPPLAGGVGLALQDLVTGQGQVMVRSCERDHVTS
jgi:hypothetical protein